MVVSEDAKKRIEEADSVEKESIRLQEKANYIKKLLNEYQQFIQDTKAKISDRSHGRENLYALNSEKLDFLIRKWDQWFRNNQNANEDAIEEQIKKMREERDQEQADFKKRYEREVQLRKEEEARREQAQREQERRQEEERRRREKEQRIAESAKWKRLFEDSFLLSAYVSPSDKQWLDTSKEKVYVSIYDLMMTFLPPFIYYYYYYITSIHVDSNE